MFLSEKLMIYLRLPTTTFIHTEAAVSVGTVLSINQSGKPFEVVALMDHVLVHTLLSSLSLSGFAP